FSAAAGRMEPSEAANICSSALAILFQEQIKLDSQAGLGAMTGGEFRQLIDFQILPLLLTPPSPREVSRRCALQIAAASLPSCSAPFFAPPAGLPPSFEPFPCPFSTAQLVELLQQPTCSAHGSRRILAQLERRHQRSFPDAWSFVRFAQEQQ